MSKRKYIVEKPETDQNNLFVNVLGLEKADINSVLQHLDIMIPSSLPAAWVLMNEQATEELLHIVSDHHNHYICASYQLMAARYYLTEKVKEQPSRVAKVNTDARKDLKLDAISTADLQTL
ncbi:hypothetical protein RvY_19161 [Ramazzottius varieornatus]|uniref:Uncharacterized protein n=1 Tax=Ramazzottius varieornatus TaxID=947166 RepID=A0A1D1WC39_RAMVA|nr:hypothetical protein RvY_19161 [Ramazzottius varieornatus]